MKNLLFLFLAACLVFTSCDFSTTVDDHPDDGPQASIDTLAHEIELRPDSITPDSVAPMSAFYEDALSEGMRKSMRKASVDTVTLPVVVHIIYTKSATDRTNIPDQQILSQIEATNHQFLADAPLTRNSASVPIQFALAKKDPQGKPTTGINRINGDVVPSYAQYGIKTGVTDPNLGASELAIKNLSRWPADKYINVWVVSEIRNNEGGNGVQGYAYGPFNSLLDGIVVMHTVFGSSDRNCDGVAEASIPGSTVKASQSQGKVFTHEMGHHFALKHNSHNTTTCAPETNCKVQGDGCCDTPPVRQVGSCNTPACPPVPGQVPPVVSHYMEYGQQSCLYKFSNDQKLRMLGCLEGIRVSLKSSPGLSQPLQVEAGIVIAVNGYTCDDFVPILAKISNGGLDTLRSVRINGVNYSAKIAPGATGDVQLPMVQTPQVQVYPLSYTITHVNDKPDVLASNNNVTLSVERIIGVTLTMSFVVDYYGGENSWSIKNADGKEVWQKASYPQGTPPNMFKDRTYTDKNCLPAGTYTLTMRDGHGDAQTFGSTRSGFKLLNGSQILVQSGPCWCTSCAGTACKEKTWTFTIGPVI